jgi:hypothetical protein
MTIQNQIRLQKIDSGKLPPHGEYVRYYVQNGPHAGHELSVYNDRGLYTARCHSCKKEWQCRSMADIAPETERRSLVDPRLIVVASPDHYRGEMSCLKVLPPYTTGKSIPPPTDGQGAWEVISPSGEVVGILEEWYGNNGKGRLAAHSFHPTLVEPSFVDGWYALNVAESWYTFRCEAEPIEFHGSQVTVGGDGFNAFIPDHRVSAIEKYLLRQHPFRFIRVCGGWIAREAQWVSKP